MITLIILTSVFYLNSCREWIIATYDYKFGVPKYYFYGFIDKSNANFLREQLKEQNIKAVFGGCMIGGFEYEFAMKYNKTIENYLPPDYFKNIKKIN